MNKWLSRFYRLYRYPRYYTKHIIFCFLYNILWNDSTLAINWPINGNPSVSEKDSIGASFTNKVTL
jgi:dTDP-4-dehydrorhamnose 3,5-epimerase-like enzyme